MEKKKSDWEKRVIGKKKSDWEEKKVIGRKKR